MARRRTKLEYIADASSRRATYRKRKVGIAKKLTEITVRCDLQACAIVYSPCKNEPEVWPNDTERLRKVLHDYKDISEQKKKELDLPAFLRQMIEKSQDRLKKLTIENDMKETTAVMNELLGPGGSAASTSSGNPNIMNVANMTSWIDAQMKAVAEKLEKMGIAEAEGYVPVPPFTEVGVEPYVPVPPFTEVGVEPYVPVPPPTEAEIDPYVPETPPMTTNKTVMHEGKGPLENVEKHGGSEPWWDEQTGSISLFP